MKKFLLMSAIVLSQLVTSQVQGIDVEARVAYFLPQDKHIRDVYGKEGYPEYELEVSMPLMNCGCDIDSSWVGFANLSYFERQGHSRLSCHGCNDSEISHDLKRLKNKAKVEQWAINGGLKYYFCGFECFRPYLGFGLGAANVCFHNKERRDLNEGIILLEPQESSRHHHDSDRWGFALLAKSGIEYDISCNFFLDLFLDYSYSCFSKEKSKKHKHCDDEVNGGSYAGRCSKTNSVNTGGLKLGLGLGYRF